MYDFWRWEYNYGHNLDPDAAIIVPGMAYQPPLIGFKQLLNFGAYSMPDVGGWIFVGVGLVLLCCFIIEWRHAKKLKKPLVMLFACSLCLSSCNTGPQPINLGADNCYSCKMTISDIRFGAELVTKKGKAYKFDDLHCLLGFLKTGTVNKDMQSGIYITNYSGDHSLINVKHVIMLQADELRSPMGGNIAGFDNRDSMQTVMKKYPGKIVNWVELYKE
jgi:copper chaperone NosL